MKKWKEIGMCLGASLGSLFSIMAVILGLVLHLWTVGVAYNFSGIIGAIVSFCLPVFAQIFWFIWVWVKISNLFNPFCMAVLGYAIFWGLILSLFSISSMLEASDMKKVTKYGGIYEG